MYMSCGCNSTLQSGGRRHKRSRQSRRKFRGGFLGIGEASGIEQPSGPGLTDRIMNLFKSAKDNVSYKARSITDATKQGLYDTREKIESRLPYVKETYENAKISAEAGIGDVASGVAAGVGELRDTVKGVVGQFKPQETLYQSGGRKHKRSIKHRKLRKSRKGGKSHKKRRTRKH